MNRYIVITGEISRVDPICDDGSGPLETWNGTMYVEANNKREAKIMAIKNPNKDLQCWIEDQRSNNCNPFVGLKVESTRCKHGKCYCDKCHEMCLECCEEIEKEIGYK